jgi:hypothetical protein
MEPRMVAGEFVPQDPNDEPASVLLDRIRAKRTAAPMPRKGRRTGSSQGIATSISAAKR